MSQQLSYYDLNAMLNLYDADGKIQFDKDKEAARQYHLQHVNENTVFFHNLEEKLHYMVEEGYYDKNLLDKYSFEDIKKIHQHAYSFKYRFKSFLGAYKFYTSYAMKNYSGTRYLERYEDRVSMTALYLADGDTDMAYKYVTEMITGRLQPATPTFLNAGKARGGQPVSCYLINVTDDMESIGRSINSSLQLSKNGGGVGINISNIRAQGDPIQNIEGIGSGVVPVMKIYEDSFSYANQLGQRQGAGAVYISVHHPDVLKVLDTKRENADEKIRIKTLSVGLIISDKMFELARNNDDMYQFSPYDVERVYGKPFSEISITEHYDDMVENPEIRKTKVSARKLFQTIAELQFESGYPYLMFEDQVNRMNNTPNVGRIQFSNLCVTGDTNILTDRGYRKVKDLWESQKDFKVIVDERARTMDIHNVGTSIQESTKMFKTAENAEVFKLETTDGDILKATKWHKMYVIRDKEIVKIPLEEVKPGDVLPAVYSDSCAMNYALNSPYTETSKLGLDETVTVKSIEFYGVEDVYDVTVENGHSVIFNGIATGQCSEILQPTVKSEMNPDGSYKTVGQDISCNLASLNVAHVMHNAPHIGDTVNTAIRGLTSVSDQSNMIAVPSIKKGNDLSHSVGLGAMNLHGFFGENKIMYGSFESLDFVNIYFSTVLYHAVKASCEIAQERSETFDGFRGSKFDTGEFFTPFVNARFSVDDPDQGGHDLFIKTDTIKQLLLEEYGLDIPQREDWQKLADDVHKYGIYNRNLLACAPTGSISYISGATPSIHPVPQAIEIRKEGSIGRVYRAQYGLTNDNMEYYKSAYDLGSKACIEVYNTAAPYIDQGSSMTIFFKDTVTTRDLNKAYIMAWSGTSTFHGNDYEGAGTPWDVHRRQKLGAVSKTIYYVRIRQLALEGTEVEGCVSCAI